MASFFKNSRASTADIGDADQGDEDFDVEDDTGIFASFSQKNVKLRQSGASPVRGTHDAKGLAGWVQCIDMVSGESYYMNKATGETTEQLPSSRGMQIVDEESNLSSSFKDLRTSISPVGDSEDEKGPFEGAQSGAGKPILDDLDILAVIVEIENTLSELIRQLNPSQTTDSESEEGMSKKEIGKESFQMLVEARNNLTKLLEQEDERTNSSDRLINLDSLLGSAHSTADFESDRAYNFRSKVINFFEQEILDEDLSNVTEENYLKIRKLRFLKMAQDMINSRQDLKEDDEDTPIELLLPRCLSNTPLLSGLDSVPLIAMIRLPSSHYEIFDNKIQIKRNDSFLSSHFNSKL